MVYCVCNNLRSACVRRAIDQGAQKPGDVHRHHGVKIRCGRCLPYIAEQIGAAAALPAAE